MEFQHNLKMLISRKEIKEKIKEFSKLYNEKYKGETLSIVTIMNGSIFFFADFVRNLEMPIKMDTITVSSYSRTESTRESKEELGLEILTLAAKKENHRNFKYEYTTLFDVPNIYVLGYGFEIDEVLNEFFAMSSNEKNKKRRF